MGILFYSSSNKEINLSPVSMTLADNFFADALYQTEAVLSNPSLLRVFLFLLITNECQILSRALSVYTELDQFLLFVC